MHIFENCRPIRIIFKSNQILMYLKDRMGKLDLIHTKQHDSKGWDFSE